jgi:hypothetical protein
MVIVGRERLAGCALGAASIYIQLSISLIKIKDGRQADHGSLVLGEWPRRRSEMSDLHEARRPEREPQIDNVGWLFLAVAVAITAAAAMVAYDGNEAVFGNAPVSHLATR